MNHEINKISGLFLSRNHYFKTLSGKLTMTRVTRVQVRAGFNRNQGRIDYQCDVVKKPRLTREVVILRKTQLKPVDFFFPFKMKSFLFFYHINKRDRPGSTTLTGTQDPGSQFLNPTRSKARVLTGSPGQFLFLKKFKTTSFQ